MAVTLERISTALEHHIRMDDEHHVDNVDKLDCIVSEMRKFRLQYEDTLRVAKEGQKWNKDLRHAVIEKGVVGISWAIVVLIGLALWNYLKEKLA